MQEVGLREIRKARMAEAHRFSGREMARAIGVSYPTYQKIERDPSRMTRAQAERAARLLGCDVEDVFYLPENVN